MTSTPTATPATDRSHKAAKRYIYAWGDGHAEGNARDARPSRRQGRGPGRDDQRGPPDPARLHDHDRSLQRLLRQRASSSRTACGTTSSRRSSRSRRAPARASATPPTRCSSASAPGAKFSMPGMMDTVLNLGLNEQTVAGPDRADRQRALRLGRLPPLHPDVRPDRAWTSAASASTTPSTRRRRARGAKQDTDLDAEDLQDARRPTSRRSSSADTGRDFPDRPATSSSTSRSRPSSRRGSASAPATTARPARSPHDLGTAVNVVTMVFGNMGDDSGTGVAFTRDPNTGEKALFGEYLTNAQGEDVVAGIRTPPEDQPDADRDARGLRRVPAHRPAARVALPRRPGPRVHDRARPPVHAPDPLGQADRGRRREDRRRHGRRRHDHQGRGDRAGSSRPTSTSCCATSSTRPRWQGATRIAKGLNASPGRGRRQGRVRRRHRGRVGRARREGRPRPRSRPRPTTSTAWPSPRAS